MPIKIPDNLPAIKMLANENIFVMEEQRALTQDIRALKFVIVNLMPTKIETETQLIRLLSNTPLQIEITLLKMDTYLSKNISDEHMKNFYKSFADIKNEKFDGLIITGAPVETLPFEQVNYWKELKNIMKWSTTNVFSTLYICWGAQAGLFYHYGIEKHMLKEKLFGIYPINIETCQFEKLFRGFDEIFNIPQSRHTTVFAKDIIKNKNLKILAQSEDAGVCIVTNQNNRQIFITGHFEYDRDTLLQEYKRDLSQGKEIKIPINYFPNNNPNIKPIYSWKSHATLFFANWINQVYQNTPYNLNDLEKLEI